MDIFSIVFSPSVDLPPVPKEIGSHGSFWDSYFTWSHDMFRGNFPPRWSSSCPRLSLGSLALQGLPSSKENSKKGCWLFCLPGEHIARHHGPCFWILGHTHHGQWVTGHSIDFSGGILTGDVPFTTSWTSNYKDIYDLCYSGFHFERHRSREEIKHKEPSPWIAEMSKLLVECAQTAPDQKLTER